MPKRIQLKRTKGWKMPPNTVKVDRTTKWGNPFVASKSEPLTNDGPLWPYLSGHPLEKFPLAGMKIITGIGREQSLKCYSWWIVEQPGLMLSMDELRGKDLACWCKPGEPCHADVLLALANP